MVKTRIITAKESTKTTALFADSFGPKHREINIQDIMQIIDSKNSFLGTTVGKPYRDQSIESLYEIDDDNGVDHYPFRYRRKRRHISHLNEQGLSDGKERFNFNGPGRQDRPP